jgi:hypothetical protein
VRGTGCKVVCRHPSSLLERPRKTVRIVIQNVSVNIRRSETKGLLHIACEVDVGNNYHFAKLNFPKLNMNLSARYEANYFIIFFSCQLPQ